jgi:ribose 5-phosphate isomerase B
MNVAVGCDHAGFVLKGEVVRLVADAEHLVVDCGGRDQTPSDYPDVAKAVASAILSGSAGRGIVVCGSGVGVAIAANKLRGIRAGVCHDTYSAHQAVEHDDMNVLCLGARVIGPALAAELVRAFLGAQFTGEERHVRRLAKIKDLENT